jgi:hypothetical protein
VWFYLMTVSGRIHGTGCATTLDRFGSSGQGPRADAEVDAGAEVERATASR